MAERQSQGETVALEQESACSSVTHCMAHEARGHRETSKPVDKVAQ